MQVALANHKSIVDISHQTHPGSSGMPICCLNHLILPIQESPQLNVKQTTTYAHPIPAVPPAISLAVSPMHQASLKANRLKAWICSRASSALTQVLKRKNWLSLLRYAIANQCFRVCNCVADTFVSRFCLFRFFQAHIMNKVSSASVCESHCLWIRIPDSIVPRKAFSARRDDLTIHLILTNYYFLIQHI